MRSSEWRSDVYSSDLRKCLRSQCRSSLVRASRYTVTAADKIVVTRRARRRSRQEKEEVSNEGSIDGQAGRAGDGRKRGNRRGHRAAFRGWRSEEHRSELQSLMRISSAVFA